LTKKEAREIARKIWRDKLARPRFKQRILTNLARFLSENLQNESLILATLAMSDEIDYLGEMRPPPSCPVYAPVTMADGIMEFRLFMREGGTISPIERGHLRIPSPGKAAELLRTSPKPTDIAIVPALAANRR